MASRGYNTCTVTRLLFKRTPRSMCSFRYTHGHRASVLPPGAFLHRTPSAPQINPDSNKPRARHGPPALGVSFTEPGPFPAATALFHTRSARHQRGLCWTPGALWRGLRGVRPGGLPAPVELRAPAGAPCPPRALPALPRPLPAGRAPAPCTRVLPRPRTLRGPAAGPGCITRREGDRGSFTGLPAGAPDSWPPRRGADGGPPALIAVFT